MHTDPLRKEMADAYRAMRKDNPAMARLFFRRCRVVQRALTQIIFGGEMLILACPPTDKSALH